MKKTLLGLGTLALILTIISPFGTVEAYKGDPSVKGPNCTPERHQAMEKAFETKDFTAWLNLMQGRGRVTQIINEQNFAKFAEAHELAKQGNMTEARKIRQELGLGLKNGSGQGAYKGQR